jgi:hypothetical protein
MTMNKTLVVLATLSTLACASHAAPVSGQGTWESTLQARDLNNDGTADAYYDTALDITWLANAGAMANTFYDQGDLPTDGNTQFDLATSWVEQLNVHGVTGWRLPVNFDVGNNGCQWSSTGGTDCGYNVLPDSSEMAHMYHLTLGNISYIDAPETLLANTGPFSNLAAYGYWSGTPVMDGWQAGNPYNPDAAWRFSFHAGRQDDIGKNGQLGAWAVHNGDIAAPVPEPETYALMLAGLGALGWVARRRKKNEQAA